MIQIIPAGRPLTGLKEKKVLETLKKEKSSNVAELKKSKFFHDDVKTSVPVVMVALSVISFVR